MATRDRKTAKEYKEYHKAKIGQALDAKPPQVAPRVLSDLQLGHYDEPTKEEIEMKERKGGKQKEEGQRQLAAKLQQ